MDIPNNNPTLTPQEMPSPSPSSPNRMVFLVILILFVLFNLFSFQLGMLVQKSQSDKQVNQLKDEVAQKNKTIPIRSNEAVNNGSDLPKISQPSSASGSASVKVLASCIGNNTSNAFQFFWSDATAKWVEISENDKNFSDYVSRPFSFEQVTKDNGIYSYVSSSVIGSSNNVRNLKPKTEYFARTWNGDSYSNVAEFTTPPACPGYTEDLSPVKNPGAITMTKSPACIPTSGLKDSNELNFAWKNNASSNIRFRMSPNMDFSDPSYEKVLTNQPIGEVVTASAPAGLLSNFPVKQELVIYPNRDYYVDVATADGYWGSSDFSFKIKSCASL